MRAFINPRAVRDDYSATERAVTSIAAAQAALSEIRKWPGYDVTPIRELPGSAAELGLGAVLMKDESSRLAQNSFKSLGGAYAATLKVRELAEPGNAVLCCATEGNHGRSVAFAAKRLGCRAVIFLQENALPYKIAAIEALGARVVLTPGNYDDAVLVAEQEAAQHGWLLVSDTASEGDRTVHHVMQGYGVMALELQDQFARQDFPTHVVVQAGVGGLAAGVIGVLSEILGDRRPTFIIAEPENAACLFESAIDGAPATLKGNTATVMQMLAVGKASAAAWPVLARRVDAFVKVEDQEAIRIQERLATGELGLPGLNIGLSGVAGLAGLHALMTSEPAAAARLGLDRDARVLLFGTEAAPEEPIASDTDRLKVAQPG